MTLMCIERSQSPTHKGSFLQGGKQHSRRSSSCSPPLQKESNSSRKHQLDRSDSDSGRRNSASNSSRYKTELCRPFEESGTCKYGDKCQFAHGGKELRSLARHPKYKTELCRTFHSTGLCPYGPRCHFIHNSEQARSSMMTSLAVARPAPLSSLGSAGDISPVSSHGGTPTSLKSFDDLYQGPASPVFDYGHLLSNFQRIADYPLLVDALNGISDKGFGDEDADGFGFHGPLTPSPPAEGANPFRLAIFDGFLKL